MADNTKPLGHLPLELRMEIEKKLRTTRAVADVFMSGSYEGFDTATVHALGEVMYYQLRDLQAVLGVSEEPALEGISP